MEISGFIIWNQEQLNITTNGIQHHCALQYKTLITINLLSLAVFGSI